MQFRDYLQEEKTEYFLEYSEGTKTLRVMPSNYMLASFERQRWIVDPDGAIGVKFLVEVTKFFHKHTNKFSRDSWNKIKVPKNIKK